MTRVRKAPTVALDWNHETLEVCVGGGGQRATVRYRSESRRNGPGEGQKGGRRGRTKHNLENKGPKLLRGVKAGDKLTPGTHTPWSGGERGVTGRLGV